MVALRFYILAQVKEKSDVEMPTNRLYPSEG